MTVHFHSFLFFALVMAGLSTNAFEAYAQVEPPADTPEFLRFPFDDPDVRVLQGWYYDDEDCRGRQNGEGNCLDFACLHPSDINHGAISGSGRHCGIDFVKRPTSPVGNNGEGFQVLAAAAGTVERGATGTLLGDFIVVFHREQMPDGTLLCTRYGHLGEFSPELEQVLASQAPRAISAGFLLGTAGNSGIGGTIHLHFEVREVAPDGTCPGGSNGTALYDPYDIAGRILRSRNNGALRPPTRGYYPSNEPNRTVFTSGNEFSHCGADRLWNNCPDFTRISSRNASLVPSGFGVPFNVLSTQQEVMLRAYENNNTITIEVGKGDPNQLIYHEVYVWNGSNWEGFELPGTKVGDVWIRGSSELDIPLIFSDASLQDENYFVGYICTFNEDLSEWQCGCRDENCDSSGLWQLQAFRRP